MTHRAYWQYIKAAVAGIPFLLLLCASANAGDVEIVNVQVSNNQNGYSFDVTLRHADTGWEHYADGWEIISPEGKVLGKRVLMHPHVNEQPFTRSLSGVRIPDGITEVNIRAHDSVHGYNRKTFRVDLP